MFSQLLANKHGGRCEEQRLDPGERTVPRFWGNPIPPPWEQSAVLPVSLESCRDGADDFIRSSCCLQVSWMLQTLLRAPPGAVRPPAPC